MPAGAKGWEATPAPTYEALIGHDALGSEKWDKENQEHIPFEFFVFSIEGFT